jgi:hypothetical protein
MLRFSMLRFSMLRFSMMSAPQPYQQIGCQAAKAAMAYIIGGPNIQLEVVEGRTRTLHDSRTKNTKSTSWTHVHLHSSKPQLWTGINEP